MPLAAFMPWIASAASSLLTSKKTTTPAGSNPWPGILRGAVQQGVAGGLAGGLSARIGQLAGGDADSTYSAGGASGYIQGQQATFAAAEAARDRSASFEETRRQRAENRLDYETQRRNNLIDQLTIDNNRTANDIRAAIALDLIEEQRAARELGALPDYKGTAPQRALRAIENWWTGVDPGLPPRDSMEFTKPPRGYRGRQ